MKLLIVICTVLGLGLVEATFGQDQLAVEDNHPDVFEEEWQSFKLEYKKSYQNEAEEQLRRQIFQENKDIIDRHNARFEAGEESYTMGVNQFADLSDSEFNKQMKGFLNTTSIEDVDYVFTPSPNVRIPSSVDWRRHGAVNRVKFQSSCGSCWTFATTAVVETYHFRQSKQLVSLSEQNILDCSNGYGNYGCHGGFPQKALAYVRDYGVDTERSYPYENRVNYCRYNRRNIGARIKGVAGVASGNEMALAAAVANHGVVAVAIDSHNFRFYRGGVFIDNSCYYQSDHAVAVVGYGRDNYYGDYWIVKNSWGAQFGENGYIRMARNRRNQCNIATYAYFAV